MDFSQCSTSRFKYPFEIAILYIEIEGKGSNQIKVDYKQRSTVCAERHACKKISTHDENRKISALLWHVMLNTISNCQFVPKDAIIQFQYSSMILPLSIKILFNIALDRAKSIPELRASCKREFFGSSAKALWWWSARVCGDVKNFSKILKETLKVLTKIFR